MNERQLTAGALSAALLVSLLPGLALAQDDELSDGLSPEGVEWTLVTLAGEPVPDGVETTLFLSGGEVVGSAGCNSYFGSYELEGNALTFPNPFGTTLKMCEEPVMAVESAYLPLLQETAIWLIDDDGALSLADGEGTVQLIYGEASVDVTASDVDALMTTLETLQQQIDEASAEVAALAEEAASIDVNRFDRRLGAVEEEVANVQEQLGGVNAVNLRRRIATVEETVERLDRTSTRFSERIAELERMAREQNRRLNSLEQATAAPE